ncbi:MAG TPA: type II toxin-antitoxin system VapC family toxin [Candidatus Kapabacteria bacterium]|nr:type II toxin-antitoxin system VapC family toxin [Candidatus Kapabacteria bacterium]HPO62113.1 type II toxin-antitoxin system VapC family toxin [Candidatus Kapabacteria bacterium]
MEKQTVYLETSVISYLTAKPSRDLVVAGQQQITQDWWQNAKPKFNCFISQFVIEEIKKGDNEAALKRLSVVSDIPSLEYDEKIDNLALKYIELLNIPMKSKADAFHLASTVWFEIDYLLSWNCKHIANAVVSYKLNKFNKDNFLHVPILCTPLELLEV